jgi:hypothetical protein
LGSVGTQFRFALWCFKREKSTVTFVGNDVVLIVDNSKFIAQAYSRVLQGLGYRVLIAGSMTPEKLENAISGILKKRLLVP